MVYYINCANLDFDCDWEICSDTIEELITYIKEHLFDEHNIEKVSVELMDLMDIEVLREWNNIDLLVLSRSNNWILIIENKIKARVSKRQLHKYYNAVKNEYPRSVVSG